MFDSLTRRLHIHHPPRFWTKRRCPSPGSGERSTKLEKWNMGNLGKLGKMGKIGENCGECWKLGKIGQENTGKVAEVKYAHSAYNTHKGLFLFSAIVSLLGPLRSVAWNDQTGYFCQIGQVGWRMGTGKKGQKIEQKIGQLREKWGPHRLIIFYPRRTVRPLPTRMHQRVTAWTDTSAWIGWFHMQCCVISHCYTHNMQRQLTCSREFCNLLKLIGESPLWSSELLRTCGWWSLWGWYVLLVLLIAVRLRLWCGTSCVYSLASHLYNYNSIGLPW